MKKILFSALAISFAMVYVTAQNSETSNKTSFSHWSLGLKGGGNYFRVVPSALTHPDEGRLHWIWGGTVEYSINPLAGIGFECINNPYGSDIDALNTLDGNTFDVVPYFSINLTNLLLPNRAGFWRKVNIFSETGVGAGFYHYSLNNAPVTYHSTVIAKTGINVEYDFSKFLALAFEGNYRYYDRADLGGTNIGKGFCEALNATVGLRIKFGANSKQHVRNICMCEDHHQSIVGTDIAGSLQKTMNSIDSVEKTNADLKQKLDDLQSRLNLLAAGDTTEAGPVASFQNIQFGFDSSKLTQASLPILNQIAEILLNDAYWTMLKISGNADSTGPAKYNQGLSERRANAVKNYLMHKKIPVSKITTVGNGEEKPIATNATPEGRQKNRRVDFEIVK